MTDNDEAQRRKRRKATLRWTGGGAAVGLLIGMSAALFEIQRGFPSPPLVTAAQVLIPVIFGVVIGFGIGRIIPIPDWAPD